MIIFYVYLIVIFKLFYKATFSSFVKLMIIIIMIMSMTITMSISMRFQ